jgi:hypothetical protein
MTTEKRLMQIEKEIKAVNGNLAKLNTTIMGNGGRGHEQRIKDLENGEFVKVADCKDVRQEFEQIILNFKKEMKDIFNNRKKDWRWFVDILLKLAPWVMIALLIFGVIKTA